MQKPLCGLTLFLGALIYNPCAAQVEKNTIEPARAELELIQFVQSGVDSNPRVQAARTALDASGAYRDAASRPIYNPEL